MAASKVDRWLESDGLALLEGWARSGLTDEQISKNMGVAYSTFRVWRDKYELISAAIKKGKEVVDFEVEGALYRRAMGYTTKVIEQKIDRDGYVHDCEREIHVPGDVTAMIFFLCNRRPDKWRRKVDDDNKSGENQKKVVIVNDLPKCD